MMPSVVVQPCLHFLHYSLIPSSLDNHGACIMLGLLGISEVPIIELLAPLHRLLTTSQLWLPAIAGSNCPDKLLTE
jgi:hypothetical protein